MGKLEAGWAHPAVSRKWHYFPEGDMFSLCRKIGFFAGERDDSDDNNPDNCAECRKKLAKMREPKGRSE